MLDTRARGQYNISHLVDVLHSYLEIGSEVFLHG